MRRPHFTNRKRGPHMGVDFSRRYQSLQLHEALRELCGMSIGHAQHVQSDQRLRLLKE